jgi:hypothetical protein
VSITDDANPGTFTITNDGSITASFSELSAPVVSAIPDQTIDEGGNFDGIVLDNYVTDPDNADVEISWSTTGESHLSVTISASRIATITPDDENWSGMDDITFIATDPDAQSDSYEVRFTIDPVNDAPEITSTAVTTATEDQLYMYDVAASDIEGGSVLTYSLLVTPSNSDMTINSQTGEITWTPGDEHGGGSYDVEVKVEDNGSPVMSATQSFTIDVTNVNDAPEITSTAVTTATEESPYSYDVEADDIDGDVLTYSLTTKPTGMEIDVNTGEISWTPDDEHGSEKDVVVKVEDSGSQRLYVTQSFTISITPVNDLPSVSFTQPQNDTALLKETDEIVLKTSASDKDDKDGSISKVDYYYGTALIGTQTTSPYTQTWTPLPGSRDYGDEITVKAVATDNESGTSEVTTKIYITGWKQLFSVSENVKVTMDPNTGDFFYFAPDNTNDCFSVTKYSNGNWDSPTSFGNTGFSANFYSLTVEHNGINPYAAYADDSYLAVSYPSGGDAVWQDLKTINCENINSVAFCISNNTVYLVWNNSNSDYSVDSIGMAYGSISDGSSWSVERQKSSLSIGSDLWNCPIDIAVVSGVPYISIKTDDGNGEVLKWQSGSWSSTDNSELTDVVNIKLAENSGTLYSVFTESNVGISMNSYDGSSWGSMVSRFAAPYGVYGSSSYSYTYPAICFNASDEIYFGISKPETPIGDYTALCYKYHSPEDFSHVPFISESGIENTGDGTPMKLFVFNGCIYATIPLGEHGFYNSYLYKYYEMPIE